MAGTVPASVPVQVELASGGTRQKNALPLLVLTSLFFMWGFLTCLNDIIIPHLKAVFELSYAQAMLIQLAFFAAYFVVSVPSGWLVERLGYKAGIVIGLLIAAAGCALFYPAAGFRSYALFLSALFVLASGITLLQVAANPLVALLGSPETASARLTLTQAFNALGTTLAPMFGSALILASVVKSPAEQASLSLQARELYRAAEAASVQRPYLGLAIALVVLAAIMTTFRLPRGVVAARPELDANAPSIWRFRHVVLGALAIFLYVGGEVAIGSVTLRSFRPGRVLLVHALGALALIALAMTSSGFTAVYAILAVGLFNSIMFPTIFALAISGMGSQTGKASGLVCMAIVGGAIIPVVQGALADAVGVQHAFIVAALCYVYVAWYGARGSIYRNT